MVAVSAASSTGVGALLVTGTDGVRDDEDVVALGKESGLASLSAQPVRVSSTRSMPAVHRRVVIAPALAGEARHVPARA
jgi:hypothetical protein